jgi:hypothetical protein
MVTADGIRTFALSLPRTEEALVRDQVKFRVGRIVYVALSRDERSMGSAFPRTSAPRWSPPGQRSSSCRLHPTCVTTGYGCGWTRSTRRRCVSSSSTRGTWSYPSALPPTIYVIIRERLRGCGCAREDDEVRTFRIGLPVHARRTQPEEPLDFGSLVVRVDTGRSAPGRPFVASLS